MQERQFVLIIIRKEVHDHVLTNFSNIVDLELEKIIRLESTYSKNEYVLSSVKICQGYVLNRPMVSVAQILFMDFLCKRSPCESCVLYGQR